MAQITACVGVDVSKDRLDVAFYPGEERFSIANDAGGWRELCRRLRRLGVRAISIEASGGYEWGVIGALLEADLPVRSVNPWRLRQFAKAAGRLAKIWRPGQSPRCQALQRQRRASYASHSRAAEYAVP